VQTPVPLQAPAEGSAALGAGASSPFPGAVEGYVSHTATSKEAGFDVDLAPGEEAGLTVTKQGTFAYVCRYHPNMQATLIVEP
jgi:hypothetical protein